MLAIWNKKRKHKLEFSLLADGDLLISESSQLLGDGLFELFAERRRFF